MNSILAFLFALTAATAAHAFADEPNDEKCNKAPHLIPLQEKIVSELEGKAEKNDSGAYSFNFTDIWRNPKTSDLTVYYEIIGPDLKERHGYAAQYRVDSKTCAPKLLKISRLYSDQEKAPTDGDSCNDPQRAVEIHAAVIAFINELYPKVNPGEIPGNFTFSTVERVQGTADMIVFLERAVPQLLTRPSLAQVVVDPTTCAVHVEKTQGIFGQK